MDCDRWKSQPDIVIICPGPFIVTTVLVLRMAHRQLKEIKQQPSMLLVLALPGSCLVSFHFLWAILSTSTVYPLSTVSPHIAITIIIIIPLLLSHNVHNFGGDGAAHQDEGCLQIERHV